MSHSPVLLHLRLCLQNSPLHVNIKFQPCYSHFSPVPTTVPPFVLAYPHSTHAVLIDCCAIPPPKYSKMLPVCLDATSRLASLRQSSVTLSTAGSCLVLLAPMASSNYCSGVLSDVPQLHSTVRRPRGPRAALLRKGPVIDDQQARSTHYDAILAAF